MEKQLLKRLTLSALAFASVVQADEDQGFLQRFYQADIHGVYQAGAQRAYQAGAQGLYLVGAQGLELINNHTPDQVRNAVSRIYAIGVRGLEFVDKHRTNIYARGVQGLEFVNKYRGNPYSYIAPAVVAGARYVGRKIYLPSSAIITELQKVARDAQVSLGYMQEALKTAEETAAAKKTVFDELQKRLDIAENGSIWNLWNLFECSGDLASEKAMLTRKINVEQINLDHATATVNEFKLKISELQKAVDAANAAVTGAIEEAKKASFEMIRNAWNSTQQRTTEGFSWAANAIVTCALENPYQTGLVAAATAGAGYLVYKQYKSAKSAEVA